MTENGLEREVFGTTAAGETVYRVKISGGGLTAHIMTWGAVIQDLRLEGHGPALLLGFDNFNDYPAHSSYFGATPGRCA
ncbi:MAG: galactose-1-epimerase, partial [Rhizobiaceae bacterium]|nr:galactose-1-epimerase [Rhizobiaceae bacterium]